MLIGGALALPVAAWAGPARRVKALNWEGTAEIRSGPKPPLRIHVKTHVEPFAVIRARSETWLIGQQPRQTRTLIIGPEGGWMERGGTRTPLPEAQVKHERQQYAIYGFLLAAAERKADGHGLRLTRPDCPPFDYDAFEGHVPVATYVVDAPDGKGTITEIIRCSDWREVSGVPWPHLFLIEQSPSAGNNSIFKLTLDTMSVEFA